MNEETKYQKSARATWERKGFREKIKKTFEDKRNAGIKPRNTSAESTAAEILVAAELGLRGLIAERYSRAMPGVDVYAFRRGNALTGGLRKIADIQVKYRHQAADTSFDVDDLIQAHFLAAIRGNRGTTVAGREKRELWIVPVDEARRLTRNGTIRFSQLKQDWQDAWQLIEDFCDGTQSHE